MGKRKYGNSEGFAKHIGTDLHSNLKTFVIVKIARFELQDGIRLREAI